MCLITSRLPCFTISKATIKSCACRLCIVVCLSRMRLLNWGRFKCFALYELIFEFSFLSWPGVSLVLSSPSYTLNPLPFSSFKSEKGYRPMKVRRVCCILVVVVCWNPLFSVRPLAAYFIMNNRIYQSPDLYTIISNRLVRVFSFLWFQTSSCSLF